MPEFESYPSMPAKTGLATDGAAEALSELVEAAADVYTGVRVVEAGKEPVTVAAGADRGAIAGTEVNPTYRTQHASGGWTLLRGSTYDPRVYNRLNATGGCSALPGGEASWGDPSVGVGACSSGRTPARLCLYRVADRVATIPFGFGNIARLAVLRSNQDGIGVSGQPPGPGTAACTQSMSLGAGLSRWATDGMDRMYGRTTGTVSGRCRRHRGSR